jgi:DNA-directed RNA polymerase specialized sigma subunit
VSRPNALTASERRYLRQVKAARRELVRQLKSLPSRAELAESLNVSERTIARAMDERPAKSAPRLMSLRELFA